MKKIRHIISVDTIVTLVITGAILLGFVVAHLAHGDDMPPAEPDWRAVVVRAVEQYVDARTQAEDFALRGLHKGDDGDLEGDLTTANEVFATAQACNPEAWSVGDNLWANASDEELERQTYALLRCVAHFITLMQESKHPPLGRMGQPRVETPL